VLYVPAVKAPVVIDVVEPSAFVSENVCAPWKVAAATVKSTLLIAPVRLLTIPETLAVVRFRSIWIPTPCRRTTSRRLTSSRPSARRA